MESPFRADTAIPGSVCARKVVFGGLVTLLCYCAKRGIRADNPSDGCRRQLPLHKGALERVLFCSRFPLHKGAGDSLRLHKGAETPQTSPPCVKGGNEGGIVAERRRRGAGVTVGDGGKIFL